VPVQRSCGRKRYHRYVSLAGVADTGEVHGALSEARVQLDPYEDFFYFALSSGLNSYTTAPPSSFLAKVARESEPKISIRGRAIRSSFNVAIPKLVVRASL
jgi:hypothetical protein